MEKLKFDELGFYEKIIRACRDIRNRNTNDAFDVIECIDKEDNRKSTNTIIQEYFHNNPIDNKQQFKTKSSKYIVKSREMKENYITDINDYHKKTLDIESKRIDQHREHIAKLEKEIEERQRKIDSCTASIANSVSTSFPLVQTSKSDNSPD